MGDVNVPLLRKVVEWVEEQEALPRETPREWVQEVWTGRVESVDPVIPGSAWLRFEGGVCVAVADRAWCGTVYCVAGKIATDAGWRISNGHGIVTRSGYEAHVNEVAAGLLRISEEEAHVLFAATNDADGVRDAAEVIAGERL